MPRLLHCLQVCLLQRLAQWSAAQGWHDLAISLFHSCLGAMQQLGDPKGEGIMHHNLGLAHQMKGDSRGAMVHFRRALDLERLAQDERSIAQTLLSLGNCHVELRDFEQARDTFHQAYLHAIRADFALAQAAACQYAAEASAELGDTEDALTQWQRLEKLGRDSERLGMAAYALNQQARLHYEAHLFTEARTAALSARELSQADEDAYNLGLASLTLGELALQLGQYSEARAHLTTAQTLLERHDEWRVEVEQSMAQLLRAQSRNDVRSVASHLTS